MTATLFESERLRNACHVSNGQLRCDACNHRLRTVSRVDTYEPMYPFCPWCGAAVTVEAQTIKQLTDRRGADHD